MKWMIVACTIAVSLAFAAGALGNGGGKHGKPGGGHAESRDEGVGSPGDPGNVTRTIEVEMNDTMRFIPDSIGVKRGETVRFVVRNAGKLRHEMVIGTIEEMKEHAELMQEFPEMEHAEPNMVVVEPGETGELIWQFTRNGTIDFACLQPGHFEAGMVGSIEVGSATDGGSTGGGKARTQGW